MLIFKIIADQTYLYGSNRSIVIFFICETSYLCIAPQFHVQGFRQKAQLSAGPLLLAKSSLMHSGTIKTIKNETSSKQSHHSYLIEHALRVVTVIVVDVVFSSPQKRLADAAQTANLAEAASCNGRRRFLDCVRRSSGRSLERNVYVSNEEAAIYRPFLNCPNAGRLNMLKECFVPTE